MAKKVRMEEVDRISNLPDAILSHILSFLSTKEAVGTSILSTRWRYLFALVATLDFELKDSFSYQHSDFERVGNRSVLRKKRKSKTVKLFKSFVDRVLFFHNRTSIEKFRLLCGFDVNSSCFYGWISAALWRGVQHLELSFRSDKFTAFPGVLFTCSSLVTLILDMDDYFVLNVPNYVCLPNLKTLHLHSFEFPNDDSIKRLFSGCMSLEEIVLYYWNLVNITQFNISLPLLKRFSIVLPTEPYSRNYWVVLDTPMLVHFQYYASEAAGYSLNNLHSLVKADIDIVTMETNEHRQDDATPLFRGINNVQSLTLSSSNLELLLSCESVPVFPNLVQLKIWNDYDEYDYSGNNLPVRCRYHDLGKGLTTLLRESPELENLSFFQEVVNYLPEKVHSSLLFKVKAIEISDFKDDGYCIEMAKYFLRNAEVVEKLTICTKSQLADNEKSKIVEELMASPRKLKQCCISFSIA